MVHLLDEELDEVFHALADPTRRRMLRRLVDGEASLSDLAAPFDMSLTGASKHVRVLERAGIVVREVRGRTHWCRLDPGPLTEADRWLQQVTRFWNGRLDALEAALREDALETGEQQ